MKQVMYTSIAMLSVLSHIDSIAQLTSSPTIGIHASAQVTDARIYGVDLNSDLFKPQSELGFTAGVHAQVPLGSNFSFSPELNYSRKAFSLGEKYMIDIFEVPIPIGAELTTTLDYLEMPLHLKYEVGNDKVTGYVKAGPTIGYGIQASTDVRINSIIDLTVASIPLKFSSNLLNRMNIGASVGAGASFAAGPGALSLDLTYQHGFSDVLNLPVVDAGIRTSGFGLGIGYSIPIGGKKTGAVKS